MAVVLMAMEANAPAVAPISTARATPMQGEEKQAGDVFGQDQPEGVPEPFARLQAGGQDAETEHEVEAGRCSVVNGSG